MNIFRTIVETENQQFLVLASHAERKVELVKVFPILEGVVSPEIQIDTSLIQEQIQKHL